MSDEVKEMWLLCGIQGPVLGVWACACLRKERIPWVWGTPSSSIQLWDHFYSITLKVNPKLSCHYLHFQIHLSSESPADQLSNKWESPYSYTNFNTYLARQRCFAPCKAITQAPIHKGMTICEVQTLKFFIFHTKISFQCDKGMVPIIFYCRHPLLMAMDQAVAGNCSLWCKCDSPR